MKQNSIATGWRDTFTKTSKTVVQRERDKVLLMRLYYILLYSVNIAKCTEHNRITLVTCCLILLINLARSLAKTVERRNKSAVYIQDRVKIILKSGRALGYPPNSKASLHSFSTCNVPTYAGI